MNNGARGLPNTARSGTLGAENVIRTNPQTIRGSVTIPANVNASSAGPITIDNGVTVLIENGATWVVV